jgi:hypothetical protein
VRLSEWKARSSHPESMTDKVLGPAVEALTLLGADRDPECWIAWGDDPQIRWTLLVPSAAGLIQIHVRVNVPGEGPRAAGKLIRWHRVQVGELSVEVQGGHRVLTFQVESALLHGADDNAEAAAAFVDRLFAAMDGRSVPQHAPDVIELSGPQTSQP